MVAESSALRDRRCHQSKILSAAWQESFSFHVGGPESVVVNALALVRGGTKLILLLPVAVQSSNAYE